MDSTTPLPATAQTVSSPFDLVIAGGPVVWLLIAMSVVALTIIIYKLVQFAVAGLARRNNVEKAVSLFRDGRKREALAAVQGAKDPASATVATAIRGSLRSDVTEAAVREEVERVASSEINTLRSHIGLLEIIGSLAPLLGLLGTVLGMIEAFRAMEAAGRNVDPAILSGGIWAALLTTAAGLIVAIPVVAVANWFDRSILLVARRTEDAVTRIFTPDLTRRTESAPDEIRAATA
ncbi:MotA/TolQ/ExbB proton channel family protein [Hyphomonas johnsonii]|uniref:MotA/TolQ/ExbB proton channel n=1 Tax=Hyphomonas johnsonii MHS-2 TaxID=1280950 RepID=A0A059FSA3_9PROT|nr:MotA/TolQ/ExbB proton channel family protein [Hyphomonas johnsonii]KCZ93492.1 MotA/TolQ/ExbB proton channel [Hyphomonas johnsonii MHS-2]